MYVPRSLSETFHRALGGFPALLITGPRQAGKTTFLLHELEGRADYVSFDDPLERGFARSDPNGFLDRFQDRPAILDEIQYVPELFPYLKMRIDAARQRNGAWILTGSQQFQLMKNVSESLAGRIAILSLFPFSLKEYRQENEGIAAAIWSGGYPEPVLVPEKRDLWVRSYIQTYLERDVRQLQNIKDLRTFETFTALCAARHGQLFNTAAISRACGVSLPTVKAWAGVLSASYICHFLHPYFKNYGKRLVKTPKVYFVDSALVCSLTRQPGAESTLFGSMGGSLFEGFIVSEALKTFAAKGRNPDIFFWRSHDGLEVDLIVQIGPILYPVEIKLTATPTEKHVEPLERFKALAGKDAAGTGILVCSADRSRPLPKNNQAIPWHAFSLWLSERLS